MSINTKGNISVFKVFKKFKTKQFKFNTKGQVMRYLFKFSLATCFACMQLLAQEEQLRGGGIARRNTRI
ncbi:hypothetical protein CQA38_07240 [Campylobacter sp. MIT 12-5580]|nr:hypothetical protein CQA38_07240 [Campylobacter sp. MIT 12-5580]